jgi:hypothetical protein
MSATLHKTYVKLDDAQNATIQWEQELKMLLNWKFKDLKDTKKLSPEQELKINTQYVEIHKLGEEAYKILETMKKMTNKAIAESV